MSDKSYVRFCADCGQPFDTDKPKKKYCSYCIKRHNEETWKTCKQKRIYKASRRTAPQPTLSISQVCRIQKQYNEANNIYLSYGEIVEKIRSGKLVLIREKGEINYAGEQ